MEMVTPLTHSQLLDHWHLLGIDVVFVASGFQAMEILLNSAHEFNQPGCKCRRFVVIPAIAPTPKETSPNGSACTDFCYMASMWESIYQKQGIEGAGCRGMISGVVPPALLIDSAKEESRIGAPRQAVRWQMRW